MSKGLMIALWDVAFSAIGAIAVSFSFDWKIGLAYFCAVKALTPIVHG